MSEKIKSYTIDDNGDITINCENCKKDFTINKKDKSPACPYCKIKIQLVFIESDKHEIKLKWRA